MGNKLDAILREFLKGSTDGITTSFETINSSGNTLSADSSKAEAGSP